MLKAKKDQLTLTPEADKVMRDYLNHLYENRGDDFANAREVNEYFAAVKSAQSSRIQQVMNNENFDSKEFTILIEEDMLYNK